MQFGPSMEKRPVGKLANKAKHSAAEWVERRARAEGNAIQRYTRVGYSIGAGVPIVGLHAGVERSLPTVRAVKPHVRFCAGRSAMSAPTAMLLMVGSGMHETSQPAPRESPC
jgi:hypothetical protein